MATTQRKRMTLEEFLELPEEEPALEYEPDGTVTQKMSPKGRHSVLQKRLVRVFDEFAEPRRQAMAFPELRAIFGGAAYVPDVAVYRWERIPRTSEGEVADDFMEPPDIALEIVSPKQSVTRLVRKSVWYVENGVRVALVVDPEDRTVLVFRPGMSPRSVQGDSRVDLDDVLPGFQFSADELFASLKI